MTTAANDARYAAVMAAELAAETAALAHAAAGYADAYRDAAAQAAVMDAGDLPHAGAAAVARHTGNDLADALRRCAAALDTARHKSEFAAAIAAKAAAARG